MLTTLCASCFTADGINDAFMIISKPKEQTAARRSDPHVHSLVGTSLCIGKGTLDDDCVLLGDTSEFSDPADPKYGFMLRGIVNIPFRNIATWTKLRAVMQSVPTDLWERVSKTLIEENDPVYFRLTIFTAISRFRNKRCIVSGRTFTADIYLQHSSGPTKHPGFVRNCPSGQSVQRIQAYQNSGPQVEDVVRSSIGGDFLPPRCSVCNTDGVHIVVPGPSVKYEHVADSSAMACLDPEKGHRLNDNELFDALEDTYAMYDNSDNETLDTTEHLAIFMGTSVFVPATAGLQQLWSWKTKSGVKHSRVVDSAASMAVSDRTWAAAQDVERSFRGIEATLTFFQAVLVSYLTLLLVHGLARVALARGRQGLPAYAREVGVMFVDLTWVLICFPKYLWQGLAYVCVIVVQLVALMCKTLAERGRREGRAPAAAAAKSQQQRRQQHQQRGQQKALSGSTSRRESSNQSQTGNSSRTGGSGGSRNSFNWSKWVKLCLQHLTQLAVNPPSHDVLRRLLLANFFLWAYAGCFHPSCYIWDCVISTFMLWVVPRQRWPAKAAALLLVTAIGLLPDWAYWGYWGAKHNHPRLLVYLAYVSQAPSGFWALVGLVLWTCQPGWGIGLGVWAAVKFWEGMTPSFMFWSFLPLRGEVLRRVVHLCDYAMANIGVTAVDAVMPLLTWDQRRGFIAHNEVKVARQVALFSTAGLISLRIMPLSTLLFFIRFKVDREIWEHNMLISALGAVIATCACLSASFPARAEQVGMPLGCFGLLLLSALRNPSSQVLVPALFIVSGWQPMVGIPFLLCWVLGSTIWTAGSFVLESYSRNLARQLSEPALLQAGEGRGGWAGPEAARRGGEEEASSNSSSRTSPSNSSSRRSSPSSSRNSEAARSDGVKSPEVHEGGAQAVASGRSSSSSGSNRQPQTSEEAAAAAAARQPGSITEDPAAAAAAAVGGAAASGQQSSGFGAAAIAGGSSRREGSGAAAGQAAAEGGSTGAEAGGRGTAGRTKGLLAAGGGEIPAAAAASGSVDRVMGTGASTSSGSSCTTISSSGGVEHLGSATPADGVRRGSVGVSRDKQSAAAGPPSAASLNSTAAAGGAVAGAVKSKVGEGSGCSTAEADATAAGAVGDSSRGDKEQQAPQQQTQKQKKKQKKKQLQVEGAAAVAPAVAAPAAAVSAVGQSVARFGEASGSSSSAPISAPTVAIQAGLGAADMSTVSALPATPAPPGAAAAGGGAAAAPLGADAGSGNVRLPLSFWSFLDQVQMQAQRWQQQAAVDYGSSGLAAAAAGICSSPAHGESPAKALVGQLPNEDVAGAVTRGRSTSSGTKGRGGNEGGACINAPCVLCRCEARGVLLLPCKHYVLCRGCSKVVEGRRGACPACGEAVVRHLIVHRS